MSISKIEALDRRLFLSVTPEVNSVIADNRGDISIRFNGPIDPTTLTTHSVLMYTAGKDKKLGTADDVKVKVALTYTASSDLLRIRASVAANTSYLVDLTTVVKGTNHQTIHESIKHTNKAIAYSVEATAVSSKVDPIAIMTTSLGTVDVKLYETQVATTVNNFLKYANAGYYDSTIIHRSQPNYIVEGGGYYSMLDPSDKLPDQPVPSFPPIKLQTGISNTLGTIAVARNSDDDNSGASKFFFNMADNSSTLDPGSGGDGYAVFGTVTGASGLDVLDAINGLPTKNLAPSVTMNNPFTDVPIDGSQYIVIKRVAVEDSVKAV